jgi:hypothetical protein
MTWWASPSWVDEHEPYVKLRGPSIGIEYSTCMLDKREFSDALVWSLSGRLVDDTAPVASAKTSSAGFIVPWELEERKDKTTSDPPSSQLFQRIS